jgi:murein DD-endopeptidase
MTRNIVWIAIACSLLIFSAGTEAADTPELPAMIEARVPVDPAPVLAKGANHLLYEIIFTNYLPMTVTLSRVEVRGDDAGGPTLITYEGDELAENILLIANRRAEPDERAQIAAGGSAMVYVLIRIPASEAVPEKLHQRATFSIDAGGQVRTGQVDLSTPVLPPNEVFVLGPPLKGGPWLAGHGLSNTAGHRRTAMPLDGRPDIAQRFAVDYVMVGKDNRLFEDDFLVNANHYAYDHEVLAVADGVVTHVLDDIPENVPGEDSRAIQITIDNATGNAVILDIGGGRYAVYAHLIPGSLRVGVGDRVRRGDVIARLGNSGNSTGPHLHFHLVDRNAVLAAEGLPYVHLSFTWLGDCHMDDAQDEMGELPCEMGEPTPRYGELPVRDDLIEFPE